MKNPILAVRCAKKYWLYQVVTTYGRERVLEWYINSVCNSGTWHTEWKRHLNSTWGNPHPHINLPEAALLAGVAVAPALNPWDSPAGAKTVQVEALKALSIQKIISTRPT